MKSTIINFGRSLAFAMCLGVSMANADLSDGLVGYYSFDDGSGDVLAEATGNGTNGELFNFEGDSSEWVEGKIGGALLFDGIDDYVIAPESPLAETALSVSIWGYANEAGTWASLVKNWGQAAVGQFHFGLGPGDADTLNIFVTDSTGAFNAGTDFDPIELEVWEHYAFVADPTEETVYLYRNGEVVDEQPYDGTFTDTPNSDSIGIGVKTTNAGDEADTGACCPGYWNGMLDDLGIWHRALSADEVAGIYANGLAGNPILGGGLEGDFDSSGTLDAADIDLLSAEVRIGDNKPAFDLTGDGAVNNQDRVRWIEELAYTFVGDSNLDGEFNSTDFVVVFTASQYEDGIAGNSTWATGDWNGD
ncbi:MAG: LamG domain-containing protein, partial [Planctomycetales bacterium]|nr:LamG domain-containing protein [Planctomycetales bacterium]